ncbi:MAG: fibronectin type III domain-containing protein [Elusimicrobia bacterium]|nr:fibronectin type III domain-containing protein [Elusimicrobiota bacterium]
MATTTGTPIRWVLFLGAFAAFSVPCPARGGEQWSGDRSFGITRGCLGDGGGSGSQKEGTFYVVGSLQPIGSIITEEPDYAVHAGLHNILYYPQTVLNPSISEVHPEDFTFGWTAPSAEAFYLSPANKYVVKYANTLFQTNGEFESVPGTIEAPAPGSPGDPQQMFVNNLIPNTTYYIAIKAHDSGLNSSYAFISTYTVTLSKVPSFMPGPFTAVSSGSVGVQWQANFFPISPVKYEVKVSSGESEQYIVQTTNVSSSEMLEIEANLTSLLPNNTYYFRVRSYNHANVTSDWSTPISTMTHAVPPLFTGFSGITVQQISINWSGNGNPTGTKYQAERADDELFTSNVVVLPDPLSNPVSFTTLAPNATYHFRLTAFNGLNVPAVTTIGSTMTAVHGVEAASVDAVHHSSVTFEWNTGSNNPPNTRYRVELSTKSVADFLAMASVTVTDQLSATVQDLTPNTTYYARVSALNAIGAVAAGNPRYANGGAGFATLPVAPDVIAFNTVGASSLNVTWNENDGDPMNNPKLTTRYRVDVGTIPAFTTPIASATSYGDINLSVGFSSLFANTTYYARVQALGHSGENSDFLYLDVATVTLSMSPANVSFSQEGSTVTVAWSDNGNGPSTLYEVFVRRIGGFMGSFTTVSTTSLSAVFGPDYESPYQFNFMPNTIHLVKITTLDNGGRANPDPVELTTSTLANIPAGTSPAFSAVSSVGITVHWSENDNSSATRYFVEASSTNFSSVAYSTTTAPDNSSSSFGKIAPNTTYTFRVTAINNNGVMTQPYVIGSTATLAESPELSNYIVYPTSITVAWIKTSNPVDTQYYVENVEFSSHNAIVTGNSWTDTDLAINSAQSYRVQAINRDGVRTDFTVFPATWTLAARPPKPTVNLLSKVALGLVFNGGSNPPDTRFAVQVDSVTDREGNTLSPPSAHVGYYLGDDDVPDNVYPLTNSPVWKTLTEWEAGGGGIVISTGLESGRRYYYVVFAKNGADIVTEKSEREFNITGSGKPVIYLNAYTLGAAGQKWVSTGVVPFTAGGSYHYHYRFSDKAVPAEITDPGWNGQINDEKEMSDVRTDPHSTEPLKGFKANEDGIWTLYLAGDAYPIGVPPNQHVDAESGKPFTVYVDLTKPVVKGIAAQFSATDATKIGENQPTAWPTPYFSWTTDNPGKSEVTSPISGYSTSFSTDDAVEPSTAAVQLSSGTPYLQIAAPQDMWKTYYFKVKARDLAGNWSDTAVFRYRPEPDVTSPQMMNISFSALMVPGSQAAIGVSTFPAFSLTFNEPMHGPSLVGQSAFVIRQVSDNHCNAVADTIPLTAQYDDATYTLTLTPVRPLNTGHLYELASSSSAVDAAGNPLAEPVRRPFYTIMAPETSNCLCSDDKSVRLQFEPGAWGDRLMSAAINPSPATTPSVAMRYGAPAMADVIREADANAKRNGGAYAQSIGVKEITLYSSSGQVEDVTFSKKVKLTLTYPDSNGDGFVDQTSPPVRDEVLTISWLFGENRLWVRAPGSSVNKENREISVDIRHPGVYGVLGAPSYDLSKAHAFPVPFKPSLGHTKIVFTDLSSIADIKIFTASGEFVKELQESDGDGSTEWDVTNSEGSPVKSGLFFFIIDSGEQKKRGKLLIVK